MNFRMAHSHFKQLRRVAFGMLILPLFDTLRVFVIRVLKGKSPFQPDRNHIHHMLIDIGLTHMQATGILILVNIIFIVIVATLQDLGNISVIAITISLAWILTTYLFFVYNKKIKSDVKSSKPEKALTH
jgi:UDP-GlcNAc:undecaprenyl-phosphate GlcNAc-1-phosphate transferase